MGIWLDGMDWREEPNTARKGTTMAAEPVTHVSPPGMMYERLGALRNGTTFYEAEWIGGKEYLCPRTVVDNDYEQCGEEERVVLYYQPGHYSNKFRWRLKEFLALVEAPSGCEG